MKKSEVIIFRATPAERLALERLAEERAQGNKSVVLRELVVKEAVACGVLPEAKGDAPDGRLGHRRRRYER